MTKREVYHSTWQAYLLLLPTIAVLVLFLYYPGIETFRLGLYRTLLLGSQKAFVGLDNFVVLATSGEYQHSLLISFGFAAVVVVGTLLISLFIAFLIYDVAAGSSIYLVAAIWPYALPTAVSATVLLFIFHPSLGVVTYYVEAVTGLSFDWFTNGPLAFGVVAVAAIWKQLGYNIIFMLAALTNIPETLTESSKLDGVGKLRMLRKVYVPLISPTLLFLTIMDTIYAFFQSFPFVDIMTSGGPADSTNFLIYKLYRDAFSFHDLGQAAAESVILFFIVAILMFVQFRLTDEYAQYGV